MTTIVIKPSSAEETKLLTDLLKKMNVEADIYDMPNPNNETTNAIKDVENRKGKKVENSQELYDDLGI